MRRASVPRPKDGKGQSTFKRRTSQGDNSKPPQKETTTISDEDKENKPESGNTKNRNIDNVDNRDGYNNEDDKNTEKSNDDDDTTGQKLIEEDADGDESHGKELSEEGGGGDESHGKELSEEGGGGDADGSQGKDEGKEKSDNVKDDDDKVDSSSSVGSGKRKEGDESLELVAEKEDQEQEKEKEINGEATDNDKGDDLNENKEDGGGGGVDMTDNEVNDEEETTGDKRVLSENELEQEWKKMTEDPNYPSLPYPVDDLTSRRTSQPSTANEITSKSAPPRDGDVTRMTSQSRYTNNYSSVPPLHIPESVRWTQRTKANYYSSSRARTDIPYSSFSYQSRYQSSRRHSIPKPLPSPNEPNNHQQDNNSATLDDNQMLISARKLDGLLFRLFYKNQNNAYSNHLANNDTTKRDGEIDKRQGTDTSTLQTFVHSGSDVISMDPVTWQLRPMRATEKETLQSELPYLEENLEPKEVIKKIFMDGVITHLDYNQLTHTEGQGGRAVIRLLIGTLQRRGENAFPAFLQALKDLNYTRIYDKLDSTERELARGLEDDRDELERRTRTEEREKENILPIYRRDLFAPSTDQAYTSPSHNRLDATPPESQPPEGSSTRGPNREEYDKEVEKQLTELNVELKALHEDINTLRTSRADDSQDASRQGTQNNSQGPQKSSSCTIL